MKKCPHCDAVIQENAGFCLNCMTPLKQKKKATIRPFAINKKVLLVCTSALLCALTAVSTLLFLNRDNKISLPITTVIENYYTDVINPVTEQTQDGFSIFNRPDNDTSESDNQEAGGAESQDENRQSPIGASNSDEGDSDDNNNSPPNSPNGVIDMPNTPDTPDVPDTPDTPDMPNIPDIDVEDDPDSDIGVYQSDGIKFYTQPARKANLLITDQYYWSDEHFDTLIEIIGICGRAPSNGIIEIPKTINGKTVASIDRFVTTGDSRGLFDSSEIISEDITCFVIPETVRSIDDHAFANCSNLADVYIQSSNICVSDDAFLNGTDPDADRLNDYLKVYFLGNASGSFITGTAPLYVIRPNPPRGYTLVRWDGVLPN